MIVNSNMEVLPKWGRAWESDQEMEAREGEARIPVGKLHVRDPDLPKGYL